jgi:hypothetical protein
MLLLVRAQPDRRSRSTRAAKLATARAGWSCCSCSTQGADRGCRSRSVPRARRAPSECWCCRTGSTTSQRRPAARPSPKLVRRGGDGRPCSARSSSRHRHLSRRDHRRCARISSATRSSGQINVPARLGATSPRSRTCAAVLVHTTASAFATPQGAAQRECFRRGGVRVRAGRGPMGDGEGLIVQLGDNELFTNAAASAMRTTAHWPPRCWRPPSGAQVDHPAGRRNRRRPLRSGHRQSGDETLVRRWCGPACGWPSLSWRLRSSCSPSPARYARAGPCANPSRCPSPAANWWPPPAT